MGVGCGGVHKAMISAWVRLVENVAEGDLHHRTWGQKRVNQVVLHQLYKHSTVRDVTIYQTMTSARYARVRAGESEITDQISFQILVVPLVLRPDGAKLRVPGLVPLAGIFLAGAFLVAVAGWLGKCLDHWWIGGFRGLDGQSYLRTAVRLFFLGGSISVISSSSSSSSSSCSD